MILRLGGIERTMRPVPSSIVQLRSVLKVTIRLAEIDSSTSELVAFVVEGWSSDAIRSKNFNESLSFPRYISSKHVSAIDQKYSCAFPFYSFPSTFQSYNQPHKREHKRREKNSRLPSSVEASTIFSTILCRAPLIPEFKGRRRNSCSKRSWSDQFGKCPSAERRTEEIEQGLISLRARWSEFRSLRAATTCNRSGEQTNRITRMRRRYLPVRRHILSLCGASRDRSIYFIFQSL